MNPHQLRILNRYLAQEEIPNNENNIEREEFVPEDGNNPANTTDVTQAVGINYYRSIMQVPYNNSEPVDTIHLIPDEEINQEVPIVIEQNNAVNARKRKRNRTPLMLRRLQSYNKDPRRLRKRRKINYF